MLPSTIIKLLASYDTNALANETPTAAEAVVAIGRWAALDSTDTDDLATLDGAGVSIEQVAFAIGQLGPVRSARIYRAECRALTDGTYEQE